jgi:hypothetical protein
MFESCRAHHRISGLLRFEQLFFNQTLKRKRFIIRPPNQSHTAPIAPCVQIILSFRATRRANGCGRLPSRDYTSLLYSVFAMSELNPPQHRSVRVELSPRNEILPAWADGFL